MKKAPAELGGKPEPMNRGGFDMSMTESGTAEVVATLVFEDGRVAGLLADGSWDHYLYLSMADREDMLMVREDLERFRALHYNDRWTVEDGSNGEHILHAARWSERDARDIADGLNNAPQHRVVWDWIRPGLVA